VIKIVKIEMLLKMLKLGVRVKVFNYTSVISWQSVVLVEETGVIGTDCIGSYHTITTTTVPSFV
jgi:hypothetical protein